VIREHAFNSRWWGAPTGIVESEAFLAASPTDRAHALEAWAWVECISEAPTAALRRALAASGFVHADTMVQFRLDLRRVQPSGAMCDTVVRSGGEIETLDLSTITPFAHERFLLLEGASPERVAERYRIWGAELHRGAPATTLQFERAGRAAGWFLARPSGTSLELTLAMTAVDGGLSGATLYREACVAFAAQGFRIGHAGFSARNLDVMNVYASLGARFTGARECWLWQPTRADASGGATP
jgi:hypothetical protein